MTAVSFRAGSDAAAWSESTSGSPRAASPPSPNRRISRRRTGPGHQPLRPASALAAIYAPRRIPDSLHAARAPPELRPFSRAGGLVEAGLLRRNIERSLVLRSIL